MVLCSAGPVGVDPDIDRFRTLPENSRLAEHRAYLVLIAYCLERLIEKDE
jgi:hypothetical protein